MVGVVARLPKSGGSEFCSAWSLPTPSPPTKVAVPEPEPRDERAALPRASLATVERWRNPGGRVRGMTGTRKVGEDR